MTAGAVIRRALAELELEERQAVAGVVLRLASRPGPDDVARGCPPDARGYFWGSTPPREDGRTLPALEAPPPASGEIVVFLENLGAVTPRRLQAAVRHELAHALGYDEDETVLEQSLTLEERAA